MVYKRIFVLGTVGSGKTTFAKSLSSILHIEHHDLDNIFWSGKVGKLRSTEERAKLFAKTCSEEKWVLEGVYSDWIELGIKRSDMVIMLKPSLLVLYWRISKRMLRREKSKEHGSERYQESWSGFLGLVKAATNYYKKSFTKGYYKHINLIERNSENHIVLDSNKSIRDFLNSMNF